MSKDKNSLSVKGASLANRELGKAEMGRNERQRAALAKVKSTGSIGNMQYREAFGVSDIRHHLAGPPARA